MAALAQSRAREARLGARRGHALEADLLAFRHRSRDGASTLAVRAQRDRVPAQRTEGASEAFASPFGRYGNGSDGRASLDAIGGEADGLRTCAIRRD